jgi:prepilin-type N-terminal cleavage/methylation domain-containing protein
MRSYLEKVPARQKQSNAGFTLMELMIAVAILVVAITGLLSAIISASLLGQANHNKVIAVNDAQYVLEKLIDGTYVDLVSHADADFTDLNLNNESVYVGVSESSSVKTATVYVNWTDRQKAQSFNITTQISQ